MLYFLLLGYLEDQKCTEAAKLFLETSPHLQECRAVLSCGRRFNTRVNGLTLMDIVEKFSAISAMSKFLLFICIKIAITSKWI